MTIIPGTRLAAQSDLEDGDAIVVPLSRGWPIVEVLLIRRGASYVAYENQCAHMPVPLNLLDRVATSGDFLLCDHHYATFRISDGYCTEGPCMGESLRTVALDLRDGDVFVA